MSLTAVGAVALAAALDWSIREPPTALHPVAWFGRLVAPLDRDWTLPRSVSFWIALLLPAAAAVVGGGVVWLGTALHPAAGGVLAGLALFSTTSLRRLLEEADGVVAATGTDLAAARERLPALAGRDPSELSAGQLRSAAVESAAENLADGLVAPLVAFTVLAPISLALAAGAAAWVKAVNTLDSMLGYPDKPHGWASARLDDVVMWLPARLSALLLTIAARSPDPMLTARRWADAPASPNSGWPMGTLAGALHVRLEKPGAYTLNGVASLPTVEDAENGVSLVGRAGAMAYAAAFIWEVVAWL
jgi:adenosylcobinamide-phosphate synthase